MIGSVTSAAQAAYTMTKSQGRDQTTPILPGATETEASKVDLSPAGKLLSDLPPLTLDPRVHMANAQKRLGEIMQQMGLPPDTKIDIKLSSSGHFTVTGNNDKLQELQDRLNDGSEMKLRNSLIGAQTGAVIQRVAAASQRTQAKVDANPKMADQLWSKLLAEADHISAQGSSYSFSNGTLNGTFGDGSPLVLAQTDLT